jgi:hypothetical protein
LLAEAVFLTLGTKFLQRGEVDRCLLYYNQPRRMPNFLARFGWEPHKPQRWHRNFIRRFYGVYPSRGDAEEMLAKPQLAWAAESFDGECVAALSR